MIGPLLRIAGRKEIFEAVAIAGLTALATKLVDLLYDRTKKRIEKDDKKPAKKRKAKKAQPT